MGWTEWLEALPHAVALRQSATLYMLANAAHILAIGLLTGAILPLDLRLMGLIRSGSLAVPPSSCAWRARGSHSPCSPVSACFR